MSGLNPFGSGHQPFNRLSLGGVRPSRASSSSHQESNNTGSLADDRQMEINYVNLKTMEENTRNLAKEVLPSNHFSTGTQASSHGRTDGRVLSPLEYS